MRRLEFMLVLCFACCFAVDAQNNLKTLDGFDSLNVSLKTMDDVKAAFDIIQKAPIYLLSKKEISNNCENRAEFAFYVLEKLGFHPINFWIFKEGLVEKEYNTPELVNNSKGLAFNTSLTGRSMVYWRYHVAAGAIIENNGKRDTIVMDPWTQGKITTLKDWALSFFVEPRGRTVYVFPVLGLYSFYGTTDIGQLSMVKVEWDKNLDADFNQMYCGLCGITPNGKCDRPRFRKVILAKKEEIQNYLRAKNVEIQ